ncbi:hemin receptor [Agrobacterium vitis]|uniref:Hemin receptor n=1 Tax=Agrobacterium vitis TaxID=373 RepID=A0ABD6GCV8_AGRVI|nr:hemin receptor [Agrobacterium vitis]MUO77996.1 hemin receptor [Agrobacterium vitis]MUO96977.1 hemin receptor [Agrobacterium vitis]MUP04865.1 hemin receptor [Agrobacterium vitis]MUZ80696.1 hemin receptor [Agrobacterium vitis]MVA09168.1 hemin receptor [Agrobacterium vitis]
MEPEIGKCGFPLIGPHNDQELELMLRGEKPMATFSVEPGMEPQYTGEEFEPYVLNGTFVKFTAMGTPPVIEKRWFCLKGQEWRGKLAKWIYEQAQSGKNPIAFDIIDLHKVDGFLLGYTDECIDFFISKMTAERK